jgi:Acyclic terpene utilisation family protein AtuA
MKARKAGAIRIGGGSGFLNDRVDAALELVERGNIDVLMMETLAERTLALLHVARRRGGKGYWEAFEGRLGTLLPALAKHQTKLVTNAGGAAPVECARMVARMARERGIKLKVAAVTGDDVTDLVRASDPLLVETREPVSKLGIDIICTNAYLGADAIADAYAAGADVVVTGRVTDSALALGPIMATLGWQADDNEAMAAGVLAGHLLECGGQATGGYFAEPGLKDVPDIDRIGFPIAEVREDRSITITKPPGSGGRIDRHTITEQILYEMHDPGAYLTPDISLDITGVALKETGPDEVRLTGARGHQRPDTLKVLVGVDSGVLAEIEISYAGINCEARAQLAADIIKRRTARDPMLGNQAIQYDLIGVNSLWPGQCPPDIRDVRLRVAARVPHQAAADRLITEVESLYVNGPSGGGGVRIASRPTIRTYMAFVPREKVTPRFEFVEA